MNTRIKLIVISVCVLLVAGVAGHYLLTGNPDLGQEHASAKVKEIEGYKNWTKVNKAPKRMEDRVAIMCAMPETIGSLTVASGRDNPHIDKYFIVYVNKTGEKPMMEQKVPDFPEGTVIVKEKLPSPESTTPELMTVMIKQKKGSNPQTGDWDYMVTDGNGEKIEGRGNLANCQACHEARKKEGYVFRDYVEWEVRKTWK
jgi:Cytochrome P460